MALHTKAGFPFGIFGSILAFGHWSGYSKYWCWSVGGIAQSIKKGQITERNCTDLSPGRECCSPRICVEYPKSAYLLTEEQKHVHRNYPSQRICKAVPIWSDLLVAYPTQPHALATVTTTVPSGILYISLCKILRTKVNCTRIAYGATYNLKPMRERMEEAPRSRNFWNL